MSDWEVAILNVYDLDDIPRSLEGGWQPISFVGFTNQEARILVRRPVVADVVEEWVAGDPP